MTIKSNVNDRQKDSFEESPKNSGEIARRVKVVESTGSSPHAKKIANLEELEARNIDITTLSLLLNNRGESIISNSGNFIYTE